MWLGEARALISPHPSPHAGLSAFGHVRELVSFPLFSLPLALVSFSRYTAHQPTLTLASTCRIEIVIALVYLTDSLSFAANVRRRHATVSLPSTARLDKRWKLDGDRLKGKRGIKFLS